ncbi:dephospho-CoA kinase [bacterium]|nr:dephospho-CoA kinase [bacterium]
MKTIILTGMMGAGKTTIAHILGEKLNIKSIDIDTLIEQNEGEKISEIFSNKGEEYFRKIEKKNNKKYIFP